MNMQVGKRLAATIRRACKSPADIESQTPIHPDDVATYGAYIFQVELAVSREVISEKLAETIGEVNKAVYRKAYQQVRRRLLHQRREGLVALIAKARHFRRIHGGRRWLTGCFHGAVLIDLQPRK